MLKKVAFTMYTVTDMNRAKNFYEKNLGLLPSKVSAEGAWVEYDLPEGGCFAITTLVETVLPSATAGGAIAFEVADLESLIANLKTNDVKIKVDIINLPVCKMAVIIDSEGNRVILHQLSS